jgi:hypothetical protein
MAEKFETCSILPHVFISLYLIIVQLLVYTLYGDLLYSIYIIWWLVVQHIPYMVTCCTVYTLYGDLLYSIYLIWWLVQYIPYMVTCCTVYTLYGDLLYSIYLIWWLVVQYIPYMVTCFTVRIMDNTILNIQVVLHAHEGKSELRFKRFYKESSLITSWD